MKIPDEAVEAAAKHMVKDGREFIVAEYALTAAAPAIVRANFADELRRWLTQFVDQYGLDDDAVRAALKGLVDDD